MFPPTHSLLLTLLPLLATITPTTAQINLPSPSGPYAVHQTSTNLTDTHRKDPYSPSGSNRNVALTLYTPLSPRSCLQTCAQPYMPPKVAAYLNAAATAQFGIPEGTFAAISMNLCCKPSAASPSSSLSKFPLVLFSPGLQGSRLYYSYLAATISSYGYVVASLDHPYEAPIIEYPDGSIVLGLNNSFFDGQTPGSLEKAHAVRVADASFVLTQLGRSSVVKKIFPGAQGDCGLNTKRAGFFGHSFGGSTALATLAADERFIAGANLDGMQFGDLSGLRRNQAVLFFGRAAPNSHNRTDEETWRTGYAAAKGWKKVIGLKDGAHSTFGDFAIPSFGNESAE